MTSALLRGGLFGASAGLGAVTVMNNQDGLSGLARIVNGIAGMTGFGSGSGGAYSSSSTGIEVAGLLKPLSQQVLDLSNEVARLRMQPIYAPYYSGQGLSWVSFISVGGVGVLVLYGFGFSFSDFMYVTKRALNIAVETLEQGIQHLGTAVEVVKRELSYKIGLVEEKVDETRKSLEEKISSEVGDVKRELDVIGSDVRSIASVQDGVQDMVQGLESRFIYLEKKMDGAADKLSVANKGISLLCNVVVRNMGGAKGNPDSASTRAATSNLYDELVAYTENAQSWFSKSTGLFRRSSGTEPRQGLQLLMAGEESKE